MEFDLFCACGPERANAVNVISVDTSCIFVTC